MWSFRRFAWYFKIKIISSNFRYKYEKSCLNTKQIFKIKIWNSFNKCAVNYFTFSDFFLSYIHSVQRARWYKKWLKNLQKASQPQVLWLESHQRFQKIAVLVCCHPWYQIHLKYKILKRNLFLKECSVLWLNKSIMSINIECRCVLHIH